MCVTRIDGEPARLDDAPDDLAQRRRGVVVEGDEGLVEDKQGRRDGERPGEGDAPAHAARELGGEAVAPGGEAEVLEQRVEVAPALGAGQGQADVLLHRAPEEEARLLEDGADAQGIGIGEHPALEVAVEADEDAQGGRLAGPGRADEAHRLPFGDAEGKVAHGLHGLAAAAAVELAGDLKPDREGGANAVHAIPTVAAR